MRFRWLPFFAFGCVLLEAPTAQAVIADPSFQESSFATGLGELTGMGWAPDGSNRLFYLIKTGTVGVIRDGAVSPKSFAELAVASGSECGLLGIAFDPGFVTNHYLYLFATVSASEQQIIRYTDSNGVGTDPQIVMAGLPTRGINHNGGAVGIGPDGKLFWSIGDNGNLTGAGADLLTLAAKVGRANLDGSAPADNPFADGDGPNNDFIWARGFRNPFTFSFQPSTERLWVNVTGGGFEQIFVPNAGEDAGWSKYEANQPSGFLLPVVSYRTNDAMTVAVTANGAIRKNGLVTIKTLPRHRFVPGAKISISGVTDTSFNGDHYIVDIPSISSFTFAQAGPDATSGGGTAATQNLGGAVTGGNFWDSSALPVDYRENFFFGDYNSGRLMRVKVSSESKALSVDEWATGNDQSVDVEAGPDGALYYAGYVGNIYRASYVPKAQGLVISNLHLRTREGAAAVINVRLAQAPASALQVTVAHASGDDELNVAGETTLTFTPANWGQPQGVTIHADEDLDTVDDEAFFDFAAAGLPTESVRVRAIDSGSNSPLEPDPATGGVGGQSPEEPQVAAGQPAVSQGGANDVSPTPTGGEATTAAGRERAGRWRPRWDA